MTSSVRAATEAEATSPAFLPAANWIAAFVVTSYSGDESRAEADLPNNGTRCRISHVSSLRRRHQRSRFVRHVKYCGADVHVIPACVRKPAGVDGISDAIDSCGRFLLRRTRLTVDDPVFVEDGVVDDASPFGREDQVDAAVASLERARVAEVAVSLADVAADRPGAILVGGERRRERRAAVHAVVEDQEQPAALELEEVDAALGLGNAESLPSLQVMPPSCDSERTM